MEILFNSRHEFFKTPFGCIHSGKTLTVTLYLKDADEIGVLFLLSEDGWEAEYHKMEQKDSRNGYTAYSCSIPFIKPGLYFYHFQIQRKNETIAVFRDGYNRPIINQGIAWQITCFKREYLVPKAFYGLVLYQIFPDRFNKSGDCDTKDKLTPFYLHQNPEDIPVYESDENGIIQNNDFFGGNFRGIIEKLSLLESLGIGAIYLNPIFKAYSNHRYDTADYLTADPLLGSNEDFKNLCAEAHKHGIKIILDGVFSHTGSDSLYFDIHNRFGIGAYHNPNSPFRDWYQFSEYPRHYNAWWGIKTLPCTEELNPNFQQFIFKKVIPYWLSLGADGWRLDVADELPEAFIMALRAAVKAEKPDSLLLGEVWEDASNKISYGIRRQYLQGESLDGVMNYVWRDAVIRFARCEMSAEDLLESVMTLCEHYPKDAINVTMNLLSTHDTPRILTVLGCTHVPESRAERAAFRLSGFEKTLGKNRLFLAACLLFCLPGSICIYYGDEIGLEGFEDPFNRMYLGNRTGDNEIFSCFRTLAAMKNHSPALRHGDLIPGMAENGVFSFYRREKEETILCVSNISPTPQHVFAQGEILFQKNAWQNGDDILLLQYGCVTMKLFSGNKFDAGSIE